MTLKSTSTSVDVAKSAGVSQATVSMVFNGRQGRIRVSDATRERVLAVAAELGYSPHPLAQALRRRRSGTIGFIPRYHRTTPTAHPVPFLLSVHLARAAMHRGYHIVEVGAEDDPVVSDGELVPFLQSRRVDGVIFDGPETVHDVEHVLASGLPVVQVIRPQFTVPTATITVDPAPGINAAIDHLVALGHRAIAFVGRGGPYPVDKMRLDSFVSALTRHALSPAQDALHLISSYTLDEAYTATHSLLAQRERPTAVFAAGDNLALGVLRALHEAQVHVPDRMSVVSYDDVFASDLYPPLSSVVQPLADVGEGAIALISELLDPPSSAEEGERHLVLATHFIARASTRPPATGSVTRV